MYALTPNTPKPPYLKRSSSSRDLEISFCLAICAIRIVGWLPTGQSIIINDDGTRTWPQGRLAFVPRALRRLLTTFESNWGARDSTAPDSLPQSMALLTCAVVARTKLQSFPDPDSAPPRPRDFSFALQEQDQSSADIPTNGPSRTQRAQSIPLPEVALASNGELYSISPFTAGSWNLWYKARTRAMMDEIESSEWQGCYTYGLEAQSRVDPPMEQIRFQKSLKSGSQVDICAVGCVDSVGPFRLDGHLDLETCNISLRKRYIGHHHFDWRGAVTPLGISGYYFSGTRERDPLGFFWLWKREWKEGF
ncbi:hypothetical protein PG993_013505 [Apiospora rasikravindrae]|uniref:Uncharacterized protein n=1 Tax=Apiospora rasikravindrae TaxID=990691 RepID=A0ABR1RY04_9PEZI